MREVDRSAAGSREREEEVAAGSGKRREGREGIRVLCPFRSRLEEIDKTAPDHLCVATVRLSGHFGQFRSKLGWVGGRNDMKFQAFDGG